MTQGNYLNDDERSLATLKDILLGQSRGELEDLKTIINDKEKLAEKVSPIIREHLQFLKENFANEYESIINELIDKKLKQSEQELLDLIYPSLGKMISKYVTLQISTLKENIEETVKAQFSFTRSIKSFFTGVKQSDLIIKDLIVPVVEEAYVIEKNSGLLLANASNVESMDKDVVAGMLTAIKAFVEDAFNKDTQDLELIEYGSYKIVLRSYYSFYIALAIAGPLTIKEKNEFTKAIDNFANDKMKLFKGEFLSSNEKMSLLLKEAFIKK